jgi:hypothetical protein
MYSTKVSDYSLIFEYTLMRGFPSLFIFGALTSRILPSINDATVPYLTAFVDLEDPFINHTTDGLAVYASFP